MLVIYRQVTVFLSMEAGRLERKCSWSKHLAPVLAFLIVSRLELIQESGSYMVELLALPFLLEMRDALGKQARFVLDIKQAVRSGEDPLAMLRGLGSHVVHVHMSDHGEYGDCLLLGKGAFGSALFWKCWRRSARTAP